MRRLTLATLAALALNSFAVAADPPCVVRVDRAVTPYQIPRVGWVTGHGGTGTVVACEGGRSLVLTAKHVAPDAGMGLTVTAAGKVYPASMVAADPDCDLALLSVRADLTDTPVAAADAAVGSIVGIYGRTSGPQGGYAAAGPAFVTPAASSTVFSLSGDSGAGVFDEQGCLVAVHWGRSGFGRQSCQCGTPVGKIRQFLAHAAGRAFPRLAARLESETVEPPLALAKADKPKECDCGQGCACETTGKCICYGPCGCKDCPGRKKPTVGGPVWAPDADGSGDSGCWVGGRFVGRLVAKTGCFRHWDGKAYGPPVPFQTPAPPRAMRPVYMAPAFGDCPSCRRR